MEIWNNSLHYSHTTFTNMKDVKSQIHAFSQSHFHNVMEFIFFERGDANYVLEGQRYHLKSNDLVITRPPALHYIELLSNNKYTRHVVQFPEEFVGKHILDMIPPDLDVINCVDSSIIAENFKRLEYYANKLSTSDFIHMLSCLLTEIIYNIALSQTDVVRIPSELSPIITKAIEYINNNLFEIKDISELCKHLCVSEPYFFKLFKTQLHVSPKRYVLLKRLQYARKLILEGQKPTTIYSQCGFDSYAGFYKQYVKAFGYPPSQEENHSTKMIDGNMLIR